ncbi:molybdopterin-guanine dinucleotide biosynthesis protein MobA [Caulobacter flavus]|uniref:Molybdopterin-guanine dinucleotide biosynthesis protein MobA n=1 Tax=Caulobacter flavus TaxID=1679497 RepID=A0A2N5D3J6_9CAUL|nr:nucleotidyltransferase family protein [Caulobacter flavus]AYV46047.1 molybdopterin-guanine dinucleotide biosynthesis protein MobA [Caulobacter flavus]PLR20657.1 molybdopterin-guanine dinucleotide biosynthesis protein MobA [Caulobacter flavus]
MRLEAIVLAAGAGTRFGGGKLLAVCRGRPLLDHALDAALAAPVDRVSVVVRPGDTAVADLVDARAAPRLRMLVAPHAAEGLGASLRHGAGALDPASDGVLVFLGDMPDVPHDLAAALTARLAAGAEIVAPVHAGRRGHPVLFARVCFEGLAALSGDRGAQGLMTARTLALVETDAPGVLFDVDRREDLPG